MQVPFYNFAALHDHNFRQEANQRLAKILETNTFIEGEYNQAFEQKFAKMQGAKHCLMVANGTDALEIALLVHNIGPGDKVGVPGITFYATVEAILNVGATPVFIDVNLDSGLIDPESLERMIKAHDIKAVMPVHIYGLPAPIAEIEKICRPKNIHVIEDAAQAQGTFLGDRPVGSTQNMVTFSFYPTKNLGAAGDAGAILCQDDEQARIIKVIRNHGRGDDSRLGRNSRCDHMQAALLEMKLPVIEEQNRMRKKCAEMYHQALGQLPVKLLDKKFLAQSSWHLYPIHLGSPQERMQLQEHLKSKNIGTQPFYDYCLSSMKSIAHFSGEDKNAKALMGRVLCLPMNPFLSKEEIDYVASSISEFYR
ncbi:MAG: DegT/DnrJ/EryC1/StrS family aminotransferase [Bdellovibrio sp.]